MNEPVKCKTCGGTYMAQPRSPLHTSKQCPGCQKAQIDKLTREWNEEVNGIKCPKCRYGILQVKTIRMDANITDQILLCSDCSGRWEIIPGKEILRK